MTMARITDINLFEFCFCKTMDNFFHAKKICFTDPDACLVQFLYSSAGGWVILPTAGFPLFGIQWDGSQPEVIWNPQTAAYRRRAAAVHIPEPPHRR